MYTLNCKGKLLSVEKPLVMGIINATPDSFYKSDLSGDPKYLLHRIEKMIYDGADIIDVGGQSTRPGSERISVDKELSRVIPVIETIFRNFPETIISVDTFYSTVAKTSVQAGASMINDISAGSIDENMIAAVGKLNVPYICMHMKGIPQTMQVDPEYGNVVSEVLDFFISKIRECEEAGMKDIIIDPGFGFGKTVEHNFQLLKNLSLFSMFERPVLSGVSRKRMICRTLDVSPENALNGTTVLNTMALMNGASVLRVHDVHEAMEAIKLYNAYQNS